MGFPETGSKTFLTEYWMVSSSVVVVMMPRSIASRSTDRLVNSTRMSPCDMASGMGRDSPLDGFLGT